MTDGCNIVGLFQAGVISLGMPESPTVKAACSFLVRHVLCVTNMRVNMCNIKIVFNDIIMFPLE